MKFKNALTRLFPVLLVLCLLPISALAAKPASQAGPRRLEGGQRDFLWPVPGAYNMSSCFLDNREHYAMDIAAPRGTPVVASYSGIVLEAKVVCEHNWGKTEYCCSGWGNRVLLQHSYVTEDGNTITLYSRYTHLTDVSVTEGQMVTAGQEIGTVGSTGTSSGPHLDYAILYEGTYPNSAYALDPYVNDLLELPEELHTTFGPCCQEYVAYVKTLYPRCPHEEFNAHGNCTACGYRYNWQSTWDSDSMGYYAVKERTQVSDVPYRPDSTEGRFLPAWSTASVTATVINGLGEAWYEVTLLDGTLGYVPASELSFQNYFASEITCTLTSLQEGQVLPQASRQLDGTILSLYPLRTLTGYLDGQYYAQWSGRGGNRKLELRGTDINQDLSFATLSEGAHTLTIMATDSTGREDVEILRWTFYIGYKTEDPQPEPSAPTEPPTEPTQPETQPSEAPPTQPTDAPTQPDPTMPTQSAEQEQEANRAAWWLLAGMIALFAWAAGYIWYKKRQEAKEPVQ